MKTLNFLILISLLLSIIACTPVKTSVNNEYQLSAFSAKKLVAKPRQLTLLITTPESASGYQTEEMLYIKKPFQLDSFAKNAWTSPPADMLYTLLVQSLQHTGFFYAVTSSPYNEGADYRLDTQLLTLDQNFLKKPSFIEFTVKIVLTRIADNKALGSKILSYQIPCANESPYGGVIAANKATRRFTAAAAAFVVSLLKD